jgi:hypothetical protein
MRRALSPLTYRSGESRLDSLLVGASAEALATGAAVPEDSEEYQEARVRSPGGAQPRGG